MEFEMSKHTPGPWILEKPELDCVAISASSGDWLDLASVVIRVNDKHDPEGQANAARIVACVNACEGLADPSVVPDLLAALEGIELKSAGSICDSGRPDINEIARAAIAKAKGGGA